MPLRVIYGCISMRLRVKYTAVFQCHSELSTAVFHSQNSYH